MLRSRHRAKQRPQVLPAHTRGLAAIAGIAFLGIKSAIGDAVSSAQAWDETSAQIVQILKDTGSAIPLSQVQAYAQQVQATTLFTQQDVLSSEALILSHKQLQGSFESVTNVAADLATKMGTDLPNATRMLTNALTDPVAGLNQLIRQGNIDFPAATVTMIQNMAKVGDTAGADAAHFANAQRFDRRTSRQRRQARPARRSRSSVIK